MQMLNSLANLEFPDEGTARFDVDYARNRLPFFSLAFPHGLQIDILETGDFYFLASFPIPVEVYTIKF